MRKTKRVTLAFGTVIAIAFGVASFSSGQSNFRLKKAQAEVTVTCDCALFGGNNNCLANNYGASCAPDGASNCQAYNANCGGTPPKQ